MLGGVQEAGLGLTLAALTAASVSISACGSAGAGTARTSLARSPAAPALAFSPGAGYPHGRNGYVKGDDDSDMSTFEDRRVRWYGKPASAADSRAIAIVVKRYLDAGLAGQGASACAMLSARLRDGANRRAAVPRNYLPPDSPGGAPCQAFMSRLFAINHEQIALAQVRTLKVVSVRVNSAGNYGLAVIAYRTAPERYVDLRREGRAWKLDILLDEQLP